MARTRYHLTTLALAIGLGLLIPVPLTAQSADTDRQASLSWSGEDELLSATVRAIAQDRNGLLWLGTSRGLVRFDGKSFVMWGGAGGVPSSSLVLSLVTSRDGSLWMGFGVEGGVGRLKNGVFTSFAERDGLFGGYVSTLFDGRDGVLWAGGQGGIAAFRDGQWRLLGKAQGLPHAAVHRVYEDHDGNIWAGTSIGVFRRSAGADTFAQVSRGPVFDVTEDDEGGLWITDAFHAVRRLDSKRSLSLEAGIAINANGRRLLRDRQGNLWVGTLGQGLLCLRQYSGQGQRVSKCPDRSLEIGDNAIWALFEDIDSNIWVGTGRGLARVSKPKVTMITRREHLWDGAARAVAIDRDGTAWVGTDGGLSHVVPAGADNFLVRRLFQGPVKALNVDRMGRLWIATDRDVGQLENGRFRQLHIVEETELSGVTAIAMDRADTVWLCDSNRGVLRWRDGTLIPLQEGVGLGACNSIFPDSAGRIWAGFSSGTVAVYDRGTLRCYSEADGLAGGAIGTIYEDERRTIWIAANGAVSRFADDRFITLRAGHGLPGAPLPAFAVDRDGDLWFGVRSGLVRLAREQFESGIRYDAFPLEYTFYDSSDGLSGVPGEGPSGNPPSARSSDGRLWFVTVSGVAVIDPQRLRERASLARVWIERVFVGDHSFQPARPEVLQLRMSRLEIDYAAAPISDAAKIRFRYKLEGFDEDWVDAGTRRQAFYTNLPPRSYKFMVSASSRGGIANASRATWEFSVAPTLYQTNLFYISGAASVALVLGTAWWLRLRAVRAEYDAVLAERMRVGREIHDTLLQSVAATALQIEGLVGQLEPGNDSVKLQLRALRKQIEENLREVRHFIRHLRWPTAEDVDVARVLHEFLDRLAVERGFRPHFNASGQQSKRCSPRVRNELLRIGQEAITNAVRHARPKNIDVNLSFADECVHLRVSDDGCGFDAENLATAGHWGMIGMRERATSCGGRFGLRSSPGAGTEVDISLPLR